MNWKRFRLALAIMGIVVAATLGRHLVEPDHASGTDTQMASAASGDVPAAASAADLAAQQRGGAEQMAVLGVIGKTFDAMRDQASMTVSSVGVVSSSKSITACLEYASKNGFGGMNRGYSVWQMDDAKGFRFSIDDAGPWNKRCAGRKKMADYTDIGRELLLKLKGNGGF
ncbi:hypothetical protein [Burkholderia cenocepacia]|uniref:hypothetical protein n=1 Tax=Burkholderia cenocepacia TaxID=95486 RepID=UPI0006C52543|nr:hypothetical protein [Burkholderia cenocepacia]KOR22830.1 hypothetical protein ABW54_04760 [Burkholderia cenocepacia]